MASLLTPTSSWGLSRRWERRRWRTSMATSAKPPSSPELKSARVGERDNECERLCVSQCVPANSHSTSRKNYVKCLFMTLRKIIKYRKATFSCTTNLCELNKTGLLINSCDFYSWILALSCIVKYDTINIYALTNIYDLCLTLIIRINKSQNKSVTLR